MAKDEHLPWLVVETAAPDHTKTIKNHFCSQMDDHLRIRVLAPVQKEEDGEPFADVLHQNAAWWTPVCKHDFLGGGKENTTQSSKPHHKLINKALSSNIVTKTKYIIVKASSTSSSLSTSSSSLKHRQQTSAKNNRIEASSTKPARTGRTGTQNHAGSIVGNVRAMFGLRWGSVTAMLSQPSIGTHTYT
jgi:hypothetical protein